MHQIALQYCTAAKLLASTCDAYTSTPDAGNLTRLHRSLYQEASFLAVQAVEAEADALWDACEQQRKYVFSQHLSEERPPPLPAGARPMQPIEFALPVVQYDLEFEKV